MEQSLTSRIRQLCALVLPLSFGFLLDMIVLLLNLMYAGHMGDPSDLAAVGLSQTFCYMLMMSLVMGVAGSLDSLMTQEFGAKSYDTCAIYFNKLLCVSNVIPLIFLPLFFFAGFFLALIGVEPALAALSQSYLRRYFFSQLLYIQCNNIKTFLRSQQIAWPAFVGSLITVIFMVLSTQVLLTFQGSTIVVIPLGNFVGMLAQLVFLLSVVLCCRPHHPRTFHCPRRQDFIHWRTFCGIAVLTVALEVVEGWNGEIMNLVLATLDPVILAANNILFSIVANAWIFTAFGVCTALAIFVGNAIGAKDVRLARRFSIQVTLIYVGCAGLLSLVLAFIPDTVLGVFTEDSEVIEKAKQAYPYIMVILPLETLNWSAIGILKGLAKLAFTPILEIVYYYVLHQPICYVLVKVYGLSYVYYWRLYVGFSSLLTLSNIIYLLVLDWEKVADEVEQRSIREKALAMEGEASASGSGLKDPLLD